MVNRQAGRYQRPALHNKSEMKTTRTTTRLDEIGSPSNGASAVLEFSEPYIVNLTISGTCDILFHKWDCDSVEAKSKAAKGSKGKKTDDVESFVYRNEKGELCIPGEYVRQSIIHASKFRQDPRSSRKSAMDLYKAGLQSLTQLSSLGVKKWDYLDRRRVGIQRASITRTRPAIRQGWEAQFEFLVLTPEYISTDQLVDVITNAGRLIGLADFRPTFGRYAIKSWKLVQ